MRNIGLNKDLNRTYILCFLLAVWLASTLSCRLYLLERKLGPADKEFLSKVRYIITKNERKIFLELPESERDEFKKEFWNKRDPDSYTEENEFKEEYFWRMEEANRLFHGVKPGWLQDRGRIYILFGPPTERIINSLQVSTESNEVWYYGSFPVIFVDETGTGDFRLITLNAVHQFELNKALMTSQESIKPKEESFDFDIQTHKSKENEIIVTIKVDYQDIWFVGDEDRLETTIDLAVEVVDAEGNIIMTDEREYPVTLLEEDIGEEKSLTIEFPLSLEKGKYMLNLTLINRAGDEKRQKSLKIEV